jgi:hypothetical protein
MKYRLIRDAKGEAYSAMVTLTEQERQAMFRAAGGTVPMIYSPGGMGPNMPRESNTVRFGGACFTDVEPCLLACLDAFRSALKAEIKRHREACAEINAQIASESDEEAGREAFPGGRFADAMRGIKSFTGHARCPFKRPERIAAWERGYSAAHTSTIEAFA